MMKKLILSLFIAISFAACKAQSKGSVTVYGFKQAVLPGMIPGDIISEDGKRIEHPFKPKFNFFIYTASNGAIQPTEIWLNGQAYSVQSEQVAATPIEYTNPTNMPQPKKTVLVPQTTKKVFKWTLAPSVENSKNEKAKSIASANELVVVYKQNGRTYYSAVKSLKEIEPVAMQ
jgi:hypothetical protein